MLAFTFHSSLMSYQLGPNSMTQLAFPSWDRIELESPTRFPTRVQLRHLQISRKYTYKQKPKLFRAFTVNNPNSPAWVGPDLNLKLRPSWPAMKYPIYQFVWTSGT
jgi:hypothetical protein